MHRLLRCRAGRKEAAVEVKPLLNVILQAPLFSHIALRRARAAAAILRINQQLFEQAHQLFGSFKRWCQALLSQGTVGAMLLQHGHYSCGHIFQELHIGAAGVVRRGQKRRQANVQRWQPSEIVGQ